MNATKSTVAHADHMVPRFGGSDHALDQLLDVGADAGPFTHRRQRL